MMRIVKREEFRRIRAICISPEMVLMALRPWPKGAYAVDVDLPPDAEFRGLGHDTGSNSIVAYFEHSSFEPVALGMHAPRIGAWLEPDTMMAALQGAAAAGALRMDLLAGCVPCIGVALLHDGTNCIHCFSREAALNLRAALEGRGGI